MNLENISGSVLQLHTKEFTVGEVYTVPREEIGSWSNNTSVIAAIVDSKIMVHDNNGAIYNIAQQVKYLQGSLPVKVITHPFGDKTDHNFNGIGNPTSFNVLAGEIKDLITTVPEGAFDFSGLNIFHDNCLGDKADLMVLDSQNGDYSGVPNMLLNQFAFSWNIAPSICGEKMPYSARLFTGMQICVKYTNNQTNSQNIYINYYLHRVVNV